MREELSVKVLDEEPLASVHFFLSKSFFVDEALEVDHGSGNILPVMDRVKVKEILRKLVCLWVVLSKIK